MGTYFVCNDLQFYLLLMFFIGVSKLLFNSVSHSFGEVNKFYIVIVLS